MPAADRGQDGARPGRQPTQALVHITLAQLRNLPGASEAEAAWRAAAAARGHGWLPGPDADAAACDATVAPVVTGHVDPAALDRLTEVFAGRGHGGRPAGQHAGQDGRQPPCGCRCGGCTCPTRTPLAETLARLRGSLLAMAADVLSGPGGLAAWLRRSQLPGGPGAGASLPLDVPLPLDAGEAEPAIPAHLRRAATTRHPHCAFPGCDQPPASARSTT